MDELEFYKKAWNTVKQISIDRGYTFSNDYNLISNTDFKFLISEKKLDLISTKNNFKNILYAKFLIYSKVKPSTVKEVVNEINESFEQKEINNLEILLILRLKPNNSILKLEKELPNNLQIMWCKQLQFNITKHILVPKHIKLTDSEEESLISRHHLKSKNQLPLILKSDPVSRYYNFKTGNIIKIISKSNNSINSEKKYRCVR
jgi:DNA-directed RNA polymerases I, II, and III subunit RPABC1